MELPISLHWQHVQSLPSNRIAPDDPTDKHLQIFFIKNFIIENNLIVLDFILQIVKTP